MRPEFLPFFRQSLGRGLEIFEGVQGSPDVVGCDRKRRSLELLELVILVVELLFDYCLVGSSPDLQCGQCTIKCETYQKAMCSKVA